VRDVIDTVDPPRKNGELVFEAPWEGLGFGMVLAMYDAGRFSWEEFRQRLIAAIAEAPPGTAYYECWLAALERLLLDRGMLTREEIAARAREFACGAREVAY
jgi:nitrile hydratase accessory protein